MFWLYKKNLTMYNFYQIFTNGKTEMIDNNQIYVLTNKINFNIENHDKYPSKKITYNIQLLDQLISYTDIETLETITFSTIVNLIGPSENHFNCPIISSNYTLVNNNRMPNLKTALYDFTYQIKFMILQIDDNLLFIKEKNMSTGIIKYYWISENIDINTSTNINKALKYFTDDHK